MKCLVANIKICHQDLYESVELPISNIKYSVKDVVSAKPNLAE